MKAEQTQEQKYYREAMKMSEEELRLAYVKYKVIKEALKRYCK